MMKKIDTIFNIWVSTSLYNILMEVRKRPLMWPSHRLSAQLGKQNPGLPLLSQASYLDSFPWRPTQNTNCLMEKNKMR